MERKQIQAIVEKQRAYFMTGATLPIESRKKALADLKAAIQKKEKAQGLL